MPISKRGFGTRHDLAKKYAKEAGRLGGAKSKGRILTEEHKAKLREAAKRNNEQRSKR